MLESNTAASAFFGTIARHGDGSFRPVSFDWRERKSDEEKKQLELIKGFMQNHGNQLVDMEASRDMTCVDGWPASDIQALIAQKQQQEMIEAQTKTLPAA